MQTGIYTALDHKPIARFDVTREGYLAPDNHRPTFGLVAVDRVTQARTVKPSARWLGSIARDNTLPER